MRNNLPGGKKAEADAIHIAIGAIDRIDPAYLGEAYRW